MFADDANEFMQDNNVCEKENLLNREPTKLNKGIKATFLSLNVKKNHILDVKFLNIY